MQDDREEFEQDNILRDRELTEDEVQWVFDQNDKLARALEQLNAEVGAHEQEGAPPCESCEKSSDGYSLDDVPLCAECAGALSEVAAHEDGPRFGARLLDWINREAVRRGETAPIPSFWAELKAIAAAIDQDRDALRCERIADEHEEGYRRAQRETRSQVEDAVERLRYAVKQPYLGPCGGGEQPLDVLDAEPFLSEIGEIFGNLPAGPPKAMPADDSRWFEIPGREGAKGLRIAIQLDGKTFLWPLDPEVGDGFALSGDAARDLEMILRAILPCESAVAADALDLLESLPPEHESAHDRRERASARNEDRGGRVEGVDR